MSIFDKLKQSGMADLIRDQQMKELLTRGEFRIHRGVRPPRIPRHGCRRRYPRSLPPLLRRPRRTVRHREKRLLPAISFATRFGIQGVEFGRMGKRIYLQLQEVRPLDLDWVNERIIGRVPFLDYHGSLIACDLPASPALPICWNTGSRG